MNELSSSMGLPTAAGWENIVSRNETMAAAVLGGRGKAPRDLKGDRGHGGGSDKHSGARIATAAAAAAAAAAAVSPPHQGHRTTTPAVILSSGSSLTRERLAAERATARAMRKHPAASLARPQFPEPISLWDPSQPTLKHSHRRPGEETAAMRNPTQRGGDLCDAGGGGGGSSGVGGGRAPAGRAQLRLSHRLAAPRTVRPKVIDPGRPTVATTLAVERKAQRSCPALPPPHRMMTARAASAAAAKAHAAEYTLGGLFSRDIWQNKYQNRGSVSML